MVSQKITIKNPSGLHARPASILAQAAGKCSSNVIIVYGEKRIQVKSILNIMAAAIKCGTEVELQCTGETEEEDLKTLVTLIESGLGE
ncbi:HPr family phosphocarrier protein [Dorea acetigenes]|jgi:phosphocarrier protein HPr|uniref:Phosphocarrier protein HPr n=1 Tax=Dorea acetigenes TaxID=2981787 RepID=A0ABT2RRM8_9FIRM|nr:HPr family phosphocarrier protein [Dorea acetigenes]MCB6415821.1 HPr family phosphocarrier protein [Faecalimonas umbilicata]MCU6688076.1 HPr family phosphocarrier protein [Dorea acetigenes]SCJ65054.1 Phosphocarrier protein HPr [uncultured Clostridium sp.]